MRTKVLLSVTLLALLILLPAIYFRNASSSTAPGEADIAHDAGQMGAASPSAASTGRLAATPRTLAPIHAPAPPPFADENAPGLSQPGHQVYVTQRKAQLAQLGMSNDPAALKTILSELNNEDPEIRKTALTATIDFGSLEAIPTLQNQLAWTEDLQEKLDIQKAIEFLQLPRARPEGAPLSQQTTEQVPPAESN